MEDAREELEADDGVDNHDEEHEQRDVEERDHGHQDTVQHNLETCTGEETTKVSIICFVTEDNIKRPRKPY